jgi:hypothetical protein
MSSHHIVRDEQEPALIIHRMDQFPYEVLGSLLEWSPTLLCCGPALEHVIAQGIKIDVAIVPFESREHMQQQLADQEPVKVLTLSHPDYLSSGMQVLVAQKHTAVNVITSEKLIHEVVDLCEQFAGLLQVSVWTEENRYTIINNSSFKKWFPSGVSLSFYATEDHATLSVKSEGNEQIEAEEVMLSSEGSLEVTCDKPPFVMVEPINGT